MNTKILLTSAALIASISVAAPAYAFEAGVGGQAGVGVGAGEGAGGHGNAGVGVGVGQGNGNAGVGVGADVGAQAQAGGNGQGLGKAKGQVEGMTDVEVDPGTTASTSAKGNFGSVISAIRSDDDSAASLEGMADVTSVSVVDASDLAKGNNVQALENAINDNEDQIADLQAAIDANASLKAELEAQGIDTSDVVAVDVEADGSVTAYTR